MSDAPPSPKHAVLGAAAITLGVAALALFILCCWSAAADAQGAVALVLCAPILAGCAVGSWFLARLARPWRGGRLAMRFALGVSALLVLFYVSAAAAPLRFISDGIIHLVSEGYALATGETPYAANKHR